MRHTAQNQARRQLPSKLALFLCVAVLLLAAVLRFTDLHRVPPGLNVDEALHLYEAYSILKTGNDEWGRPWPITFRAFNDYRRPATIYSAVPFVAIFGLNVVAIRAMAAFWGWLAIVLTYRLATDLFGRSAGLGAAFVLTLSSWHVGFSRMGVEASGPLLATLILGLDLGWRWYKSRKSGWLIAAAAAFGLSLYTYTVTQALTPLLVAALAVIFIKPLWRQPRAVILAGFTLIAIGIPLAVAVLGNEVAWNRFNAISLFSEAGGVRLALEQWLGHFAPGYLFFAGDASPIHHIPGYGQLYWIEMLLVPLGLLGLVRSPADSRAKWLVVAWLLLSPVPAALTRQDMGSANSMRALSGVAPWAILSGLGIVLPSVPLTPVLRKGMAAALQGVLIGAFIWNAGLALVNYFTEYPIVAARAFEYGIEEAMDYVLARHYDYDGPIILTDWISQPHIFAVVYAQYDPAQFQANHAPYGQRLSEKLSAWGDRYRTGDVDALYAELDRGIFVARPHMLPDIAPVFVVNHPDGSPSFKVIVK